VIGRLRIAYAVLRFGQHDAQIHVIYGVLMERPEGRTAL
jgi:hypothetical protein